MKTFYFSRMNMSVLSLFGILSLVVTSCGSFQNSSYYDNDGVYGSDENPRAKVSESNNSGYYKEYFGNLKKDNEVFTNVDSYTSATDSLKNESASRTVAPSNNAGWGSNSSDNVTINIYDNGWNNWGYYNSWAGNNWGWNNGWYGNYWGWNNWYGPGWYGGWYGGYYGYNYNNWGWYGGNLGHNYAYSGGRRNNNRIVGSNGGVISGGRSNGIGGGRNSGVFGSRDYNNPLQDQTTTNTILREQITIHLDQIITKQIRQEITPLGNQPIAQEHTPLLLLQPIQLLELLEAEGLAAAEDLEAEAEDLAVVVDDNYFPNS